MNKQIDGIFYPSAITNNEGINLVLTPNAVNKYLQLAEVGMVKFERWKSDPKHYSIFQCSELVKVVDQKFKLKVDDHINPVPAEIRTGL